MPSSADCFTLQALAEAVASARQTVELEWGAERLPLLLDDETRAKLHRQKAKWSTELQEAWDTGHIAGPQLEQLKATAAAMQRMYPALVAKAVEAGHRPIAPWVWETLLPDGTVLAIVQTDDEAAKVIADGRYVAVYTLREVANVIGTLLPESLQLAKVVWPGAKFTGSGDRSWVAEGDEIPFGERAA